MRKQMNKLEVAILIDYEEVLNGKQLSIGRNKRLLKGLVSIDPPSIKPDSFVNQNLRKRSSLRRFLMSCFKDQNVFENL